MKIVGYKKSDFRTPDGTQITGITVYAESDITCDGKGIETEKFYLSENKMKKMNVNIDSLLGMEVRLGYNRWGKVDFISEIEK